MTATPGSDETRLSLLSELAEASAHLEQGASDAERLDDPNLAASISSVRLQSNDLMRKRMREVRLAAGLTQAELARRAGVPRRAVADFESGRAVVPDVVSALAPLLGLPDPSASRDELQHSVVRRARTAAAGEHMIDFEVVATGVSMEPTVRHGDLLLVSPSVELSAGRIVVARHNEVWIVKRLADRDGAMVLRSDNADEELALSAVEIQGTVVELRRTL